MQEWRLIVDYTRKLAKAMQQVIDGVSGPADFVEALAKNWVSSPPPEPTSLPERLAAAVQYVSMFMEKALDLQQYIGEQTKVAAL